MAVVGGICALIGFIWCIVIAFQNGDTVWGVVSIFCGLAAFIYGCTHFQQAKNPMLIWIAGIVLAIVGQVMLGAAGMSAMPTNP